MHQRKRTHRCRRRITRRAVSAVEAAIALPVVVFLTFGFIEIGWYAHCAQLVHNAARQGAREAVRTENSNEEVEAAVLASLNNSITVDSNDVDVRISCLDSSGNESYQVMNLSENEEGYDIRVTVTLQYSEMRPPYDLLGLAIQNISGSAVMQRSQ